MQERSLVNSKRCVTGQRLQMAGQDRHQRPLQSVYLQTVE